MKRMMLIVAAAALVAGCSSDKNTYVEEAPLLPDQPTNGTTLIVTAEGESTAVIGYTEVGDGSILVNCGDYCGVYIGSLIDTEKNDDEAGIAGQPTPAPRPVTR